MTRRPSRSTPPSTIPAEAGRAPVTVKPMKKGPRTSPIGASVVVVDAAEVEALARMNVTGYVEEVVAAASVGTGMGGDAGKALKGWAFDHGNPQRHVALHIEIDGVAGPLFTADLERADLVAAGLPRSDCGFVWTMPAALADGVGHRFAVRAGNGAALVLLQDMAAYASLWDLRVEPAPEPKPEVALKPAVRAEPVVERGADLKPVIAQSALFDAAFYLSENPGIVGADESAWEHFLRVGAAEMRNPNALFDIRHYREANAGLEDLVENPLLHWQRLGRAEGLSTHWMFSAADYLRLNPDLPRDIDALHHAVAYGIAENRAVFALFDPAFYLAQNPDVAAAGIPALLHFLRSGDREDRAPHVLFDPVFYARDRDTDGRDTEGMGALEHYLRTNSHDSPHPLFDAGFYRGLLNDPDAARIPPLLHYATIGAARGLDPHPLFDTAHYLRISTETQARANPLAHYLSVGRLLGRSPHPLFHPGWYAGQPARRSWDGKTLPTTGPLISVIVPVYNTPAKVLAECIESVLRQTYVSWELCIVDDGSRSPGTASTLAAYRNRDPRIRIDRTMANLHIARATNRAAMQASGEFLAFLDHDDTLEPEALAEAACAIMANPEIDLLYTDEDKIDAQGRHTEPYCKPDWSPDHLNSVMYVLHMLTVRKSLFWAVGGSRPERTGAQDYDLALRVARRARAVHHIPRILYHWRIMAGSAAGELDAKPYALEAGRAALQDAVDAEGLEAEVVPGLLQGTFRVRPRLATPPPVTLLISTNDGERVLEGRGIEGKPVNLVRNFLRSIAEKSTYRNHRIVVVDNANSSAETRKLAKDVGAKIVSYKQPGPFNYARKANFATRAAGTENVIHLNDDMEVIAADWIEALLELSTREAVGGVGARLLYPDGRVQHAGVILGVHGATGHAFLNLERDVVGYNAFTHVIRNYSAVTGAVFATRKAVLEEVEGFDERLAIDYNDIDLCLRIGRAGRRIVYTPFCELYHFEGSSAKRTSQNPTERALFLERWAPLIERDPFYNPNLPRDRTGFA